MILFNKQISKFKRIMYYYNTNIQELTIFQILIINSTLYAMKISATIPRFTILNSIKQGIYKRCDDNTISARQEEHVQNWREGALPFGFIIVGETIVHVRAVKFSTRFSTTYCIILDLIINNKKPSIFFRSQNDISELNFMYRLWITDLLA